MGGICRVYVYCVPNFCVVVFQHLLSPIDWDYVVRNRFGNCFGQVVCPSFPFRPACPLIQWKVVEVEFLSLFSTWWRRVKDVLCAYWQWRGVLLWSVFTECIICYGTPGGI